MSSRKIVVLGGGAPGEHFVGALRRLGDDSEVALVEKHLVGGECSYYACMPTKVMLRTTELAASLDRAPFAPERPDPAGVWEWRDWMTSDWHDDGQVKWLAEHDCRLVRGEGRIARAGVVDVDGEELEYDVLVLATGSVPIVPDAVAGVEHWTNREAVMVHDVPESLAVMGSGPVGAELSQFFARMGSRVTMIERGERILGRVHADAAARIADEFRDDGIELRVGVAVEGAEPGVVLRLSDGSHVEAERLLVATGRRASIPDGVEALGVTVGQRGVEVDEHCRAAENVWALGDVTGVAQFTHVGKYQARVIAANLCGREARADYRAIPAGIFTDPEIGTVGRTDGVSVRWELSSTPRTSTYEKPKRDGFVRIFADPDERVLVGAVCVGPQATEWLGQLTLAVRSATPIDVLVDTIQPYPTFSEAIFFAVQELAASLS